MARFVLVHASWQGAWCWREIVPRLLSMGHEALAFDLPGHGEDRSPPQAVTFQDYVDRTIEAVDTSPEAPILVGHCMGAGVVSQAAEFIPGRLRALVCVSALLPPSGSSMMTLVGGFSPEYLAQLLWAQDRRTARITRQGAATFLYSQCPPALVESVFPLFTAEPIAPYEAPLAFTEENLGRSPRYYIECLGDRVIPIATLRSARSAVPSDRVYTLDADHSPFFSAPEDLSRVLHAIAERA